MEQEVFGFFKQGLLAMVMQNLLYDPLATRRVISQCVCVCTLTYMHMHACVNAYV